MPSYDMHTFYGIFHREADGGFRARFPDAADAEISGRDLNETVAAATAALSDRLLWGGEKQLPEWPTEYEAVRDQAEAGDRVLPIQPRVPIRTDERPRRTVDLQLPESQLRAMDELGKSTGQDRSAFITRALDFYLYQYYANERE